MVCLKLYSLLSFFFLIFILFELFLYKNLAWKKFKRGERAVIGIIKCGCFMFEYFSCVAYFLILLNNFLKYKYFIVQ
jgi:hypothetical protein